MITSSIVPAQERFRFKVRKVKVSLPLKEQAKSKVIQSVVIGLWS